MDITLQEVAGIIDESKGSNHFSNQLESALQPLFKKLKSVESSKENLSVMSLFNLDGNKSKKFRDRYEAVLESFLTGFESKTKDGIVGKVSSTTPQTVRTPNPSKGIEKLLQRSLTNTKFDTEEGSTGKEMNVHVVSISDELMKQLGSARESTSVVIEKPDKGSDGREESSGGLLSKIGMAIKGLTMAGLAAGLIVGGVSLAMKGLIDGGPTKGLFKMVGNVLIEIGDIIFKKITKNISNIMTPIAKLFSFKAGKGGASKVGGVLSTAFKKIFKPILSLGKGMGKGAKLVFKSIPYLGSIISLAFAVSRFKEGDMVGGLLELTSALLGLVPIPGLALIPDVVLMFRDFTMSEGEKYAQGGGFMEGLAHWFKNLPFVQSLTNVFTGLGLIFGAKNDNDVNKGIEYLTGDNGILSLIFPEFGTILRVFDWFRYGGFRESASSVLGGLFGGVSYIFETMGKIIGKLFTGFGEIIGKIMKTNVVKSIKLRFGIAVNKVELAILEFANRFEDIINWITTPLRGTMNGMAWVGNKLGGNFDYVEKFDGFNVDKHQAKMAKDILELGKIEQAKLDTVNEVDKAQAEHLKMGDRVQKGREIDRKNAEKKRLEDAQSKRDKNMSKERHEELVGTVAATGAAQIAAIGSSAAKIASSLASNEVGGGRDFTNVFTEGLSQRNAALRTRTLNGVYGSI